MSPIVSAYGQFTPAAAEHARRAPSDFSHKDAAVATKKNALGQIKMLRMSRKSDVVEYLFISKYVKQAS